MKLGTLAAVAKSGALQAFAGLAVPPKIAWSRIKKLEELEKEFSRFTGLHVGLLKKHGAVLSADGWKLDPKSPTWPAFQREFDELSEIESDVAVTTVAIVDIGEGKISATHVQALIEIGLVSRPEENG